VEQRDEGFSPPEPAGPEPDLRGGKEPPQQQQPPPPPPGYQPPPSYQPPPASYPPPPQPGWQQPPPYQPPTPGYYGWQPPYVQQPGNGQAVAGFVVSMVSAALWLFSAGFGTPLTIPGAIVGMVLARQGQQKVKEGETTKHKDLATAGWWIGIAVLVLSVISTIAWVLVLVLAANSDSFNDNMKHELQDSQTSGGLRIALAVVSLGARLVS
jgi:hypothetical protein